MGSLAERLGPYFKPRPRRPPGPPAVPASSASASSSPDPALASRTEELARELARLTWDLGGLTYEMAIRDHFRVDVLVRQAARVQQVDADLGALERIARLEQAGAAGDCPACGALYPRGAAFCSRCGTSLMETVSVTPQPPAPAPAPPVQAPLPAYSPPQAPPPQLPPPPQAWPQASVGPLS